MSGADPRVRAVLKLAPVIPVFTPDDVDDAVQVAQALFRGGLPVVEVTLRTPRAMEAIKAMAEAVPDAVIGAGTVLTAAQMQAVKEAGGRFAVSPGATDRLYAAARDTDLPFLPGVANAGDIMRGMDLGLDRFKFFPAATSGGIPALKALAGGLALRPCAARIARRRSRWSLVLRRCSSLKSSLEPSFNILNNF